MTPPNYIPSCCCFGDSPARVGLRLSVLFPVLSLKKFSFSCFSKDQNTESELDYLHVLPPKELKIQFDSFTGV